VGDQILTLPLWSYMDDQTLMTVANGIRSFWRQPAVSVTGAPRVGRDLLTFAKSTHYTLPIADVPGVQLRSVTPANPDAGDVTRLTEWRNRNVRSFLTEFDATEERTRHWLQHSVAQDDSRILFMIVDEEHHSIGYIGIGGIDWERSTAEADSVVRGTEAHPGVMSAAMRTIIDWARQELKIKTMSVRVLGDNPAVAFYNKCGFIERRRQPLNRVDQPDCVAWQPTPHISAATRWLLHLELHQ
jgi:RimJ/RimL family protein N-acetyltransferase